jgi:hypothetical protein
MGDRRSEKARRLNTLETFRRNVPHVSQNGLSAVLQEVKRNGLPELTSRNDMRSARNTTVDTTMTDYGPLYQTLDMLPAPSAEPGVTPKLNFIHPLALLSILLTTCAGFSAYVEELHASCPSSHEAPWGLILYSDEVTPGNQLSHNNKRKMQAVYFSFCEFKDHLHDEDFWFTITAKRSSRVNESAGNMSQLFGLILKLLFVTHACADVGSVFTLMSGAKIRLYIKLKIFVQDGGAHKITWHCKGDSGCKFCLLCRNLFSEACELADVDDDGNSRCNVIKFEELELATSDELIEACRRVHAHRSTDTPDVFNARQIACGFTYMSYNMLVDDELDDIVQPADQFMHDWMHCLFVSGVWNITFQLVLKAMHAAGITDLYNTLYTCCERWHWPMRLKQAKMQDHFAEGRREINTKGKKFKCQASQGLSLYAVVGIVLHLFYMVCPGEVAVYFALCDVIDCLSCFARGKISHEAIQRCVHTFLQRFCDVFGFGYMTPKFHWLLHFGDYAKRFGLLVACYVHERKHKMVKRYCNDLRNTVAFEHSVLAEVNTQTTF